MNINQIAICCISMDLSQRALQTNENIFSYFELVFDFFAKKKKIFKQIEGYVLYINGSDSDSSSN